MKHVSCVHFLLDIRCCQAAWMLRNQHPPAIQQACMHCRMGSFPILVAWDMKQSIASGLRSGVGYLVWIPSFDGFVRV